MCIYISARPIYIQHTYIKILTTIIYPHKYQVIDVFPIPSAVKYRINCRHGLQCEVSTLEGVKQYMIIDD